MAGKKWSILVAFFILLIFTEAVIAQGQGNGNGKGKDEEKGDKYDDQTKEEGDKPKTPKDDDKPKTPKVDDKPKKEKDDKPKTPKVDDKPKKEKDDKPKKEDSANYESLTPLPSGEERGFCQATSACQFKTLVCPSECRQRKPKKNKIEKGCFIDCSSKCEATCKVRRANCDGYGSLCYDPRFVGGDGVMFYFHGAKGGNFAIVSDDEFQINAHFIGTRPQGRTRDYTWVQALAVMFDTHTLVISANKVTQWSDNVDSLSVKWDGQSVNVPLDGEAEWKGNSDEREVVVERTDETNSLRVTVSGLLEMDIRVRPIGETENKVHNYQLPSGDAFAHLETQFRFKKPTDFIEGVLGQTYKQGYVSPVKRGVSMPMMGGEDKYQTTSLFSTSCKLCRFQRPSGSSTASEGLIAQY